MELKRIMQILSRREMPSRLAPNVQITDETRNHLALMDPDSTITDTPDERLAVDEKTMSVGFVITTSQRDRAGDIVMPEGCLDTLHEYRANPVVFFSHQTHLPPVASTLSPVNQELSLWVEPDRIVARAWFHGKTRESSEVFDLIASGVLRAASIGFTPHEAEMFPAQKNKPTIDETDVVQFDMGGFVFWRWTLLEWSVVPIPTNPEALRSVLDRNRVRSPYLKHILSGVASRRSKTIWLDSMARTVCKSMALDSLIPPPAFGDKPPMEVDIVGNDVSREAPQSVILSCNRFNNVDEASHWLANNGLSSESLYLDEKLNAFVAIQFSGDLCEPETVRHEQVEDGVELVFCRKREKSLKNPNSEQEPTVKSDLEATRPFGNKICHLICTSLWNLHEQLLTLQPLLERDSRVYGFVDEFQKKVVTLYNSVCDFVAEVYPNDVLHEKILGYEDTEEKGMNVDLHEVSSFLDELSRNQHLTVSERFTCRSFAQMMVDRSTKNHLDLPEIENSLRELQEVFYSLTGKNP